MLRKYAGCAGLAALFLAPSAYAHRVSGVQAEPAWRLLAGVAVSF